MFELSENDLPWCNRWYARQKLEKQASQSPDIDLAAYDFILKELWSRAAGFRVALKHGQNVSYECGKTAHEHR